MSGFQYSFYCFAFFLGGGDFTYISLKGFKIYSLHETQGGRLRAGLIINYGDFNFMLFEKTHLNKIKKNGMSCTKLN